MPDLPVHRLIPVPSVHGSCFEFVPESRAAGNAVSWAATQKGSNITMAFIKYMHMVSSLKRHSECPPIDTSYASDPRTHLTPSVCQLAGRCICTGDGLLLKAMVLALKSRIFQVVFKGDRLLALRRGFVIVRLQGTEPRPPKDPDFEVDEFLHVGFKLITPNKLSFQKVEHVREGLPDDHVFNPDMLYVKARASSNTYVRECFWGMGLRVHVVEGSGDWAGGRPQRK